MSKIDVNKCLSEDFVEYKYKYHFFEKFDNIDIRTSEKIYNNAGLPDPDAFSEILYDYFAEIWNLNYPNSKVKKIWNGNAWELIGIKDNFLRLGTDSIMSIYWHRFNMREFIIKLIEGKKYDFQIFIREYLKKANTIGGFVLFPRHIQSINQRRGTNSQIDDRFDLTLECIKRYYTNREKSETESNYNPLSSVLKNDATFFDMFGKGEAGFKNYAEFFCLNESWVENGQVLNLMNNEPLDNWDFKKEPLPQNLEEWWWKFYENIMSRLDARNEQIKNLINKK